MIIYISITSDYNYVLIIFIGVVCPACESEFVIMKSIFNHVFQKHDNNLRFE